MKLELLELKNWEVQKQIEDSKLALGFVHKMKWNRRNKKIYFGCVRL